MTLQAWIQAGWLRTHDTRPAEIQHLWDVAHADLRSAGEPQHEPPLRFEYAYNAALKCCLIALYAERARPGMVSDVHHKIIRALPLVLGPDHGVSADYLDACRERRDGLATGPAAVIGEADAESLRRFAEDLGGHVRAWLQEKHPTLAVG